MCIRDRVQANLVKLRKRGRMLVASYEAVRYQKLDLFSVTLRQIGSHIAQMLLADAVDVLIHGDGNDNAAAASETKGCLLYTSSTGASRSWARIRRVVTAPSCSFRTSRRQSRASWGWI